MKVRWQTDDFVTGTENVALSIDGAVLTANDTDVDDLEATVIGVSNLTNGSVALTQDGHIVFTPDQGFLGDATFEYAISDPSGETSTATATVTVEPNVAPEADDNVALTVAEDGSLMITEDQLVGASTDANTNDNVLRVNIDTLTAVDGGTLNLVDDGAIEGERSWTYTPASDFNGSVQLSYDVSDGTASDPTSASITVTAVNDASTITGDTFGTASEDAVPSATTGQISAIDIDGAAEETFQPQTDATVDYGTFSIDASGAWTFILDNTDAAVQALGAGDSLSSSVTVATQDGTAHTVSLMINGTNDAPQVVSSVQSSANEDDTHLTLDLLDGVSDADAGDSLFVDAASIALTSGDDSGVTINSDGTLTVDPHAYTSLPAGTDEVVTYSYDIVDTAGARVQQTASVTITGADDAPTIGGVAFGSTFEDMNVVDGNLTASGALSIADVDAGEAGFQASTITGQYGSLTIDAGGAWTYTADNSQAAIQGLDVGEFLTDTVTVYSADGTPQTVSVEINGADEIVAAPTEGAPPETDPNVVDPAMDLDVWRAVCQQVRIQRRADGLIRHRALSWSLLSQVEDRVRGMLRWSRR